HTRSKRDWSSDVCSSDLRVPSGSTPSPEAAAAWAAWFDELGDHLVDRGNPAFARTTVGNCGPGTVLGGYTLIDADDLAAAAELEIGRASCRERGQSTGGA